MINSDLDNAYEFLDDAKTYFLATIDGDSPRVRPFGTILKYDNKLWILTGANKKVYAQIKANPRYELSAVLGSRWLRLHGELVADNSLEAQTAMLERYPHLQALYKPGDGVTATFYLDNTTGTIESFNGEHQELKIN